MARGFPSDIIIDQAFSNCVLARTVIKIGCAETRENRKRSFEELAQQACSENLKRDSAAAF
jgi:hypothetical protein